MKHDATILLAAVGLLALVAVVARPGEAHPPEQPDWMLPQNGGDAVIAVHPEDEVHGQSTQALAATTGDVATERADASPTQTEETTEEWLRRLRAENAKRHSDRAPDPAVVTEIAVALQKAYDHHWQAKVIAEASSSTGKADPITEWLVAALPTLSQFVARGQVNVTTVRLPKDANVARYVCRCAVDENSLALYINTDTLKVSMLFTKHDNNPAPEAFACALQASSLVFTQLPERAHSR